jgi:1,4-dihydroxy-2-naphthoate octaprenyltransferase
LDLLNINQLLYRNHSTLKKSTLLHLRIPFSFFLLPVFLLACAVADNVNTSHFLLSFFILHLLVYPASNGYNSYFDKDEKSIGGLRNPPKVSKELYWMSLVFDLIGLTLGLFISFEFVVMIFIYGLISKAYSHPSIRLKKMPIIGWLAAGVFQGYFTFLLSYIALADVPLLETFHPSIQIPGILSSVLLLGSYPMTQIYQHEEDEKRGDITMSILLGIKGTFLFTAIWFTVSTLGFLYYFSTYYDNMIGLYFLTSLSPVLIYFGFWYFRVRKEITKADFTSTMRLNLISSLALNLFFLYLWFS